MYLGVFLMFVIICTSLMFFDVDSQVEIAVLEGENITLTHVVQTANVHGYFDVYWDTPEHSVCWDFRWDVDINRHCSTNEKYSLSTEYDTVDAGMSIVNVKKIDEGRYFVHVFPFIYPYMEYQLIVVVPPIDPYPLCTITPLQAISEKHAGTKTIVCESRGGDPPSTLSLISSRNETITYAEPIGNTTYLIYTFQPDIDDHGLVFICKATQAGIETGICETTPIEIIPAPPVILVFTQVDGSMLFACTVESKHQPVSFNWYFNNEHVVESSRFRIMGIGDMLQVMNVSSEDNGTSVKCTVTNRVGVANADIEIYLPEPTGNETSTKNQTELISSSIECPIFECAFSGLIIGAFIGGVMFTVVVFLVYMYRIGHLQSCIQRFKKTKNDAVKIDTISANINKGKGMDDNKNTPVNVAYESVSDAVQIQPDHYMSLVRGGTDNNEYEGLRYGQKTPDDYTYENV